MDHIDWKAPEDSNEKRRPFVVKVEEQVARNFIKAVQSQGLFVRETVVKLMREFARRYNDGPESTVIGSEQQADSGTGATDT